jgi:hypothetical protein
MFGEAISYLNGTDAVAAVAASRAARTKAFHTNFVTRVPDARLDLES